MRWTEEEFQDYKKKHNIKSKSEYKRIKTQSKYNNKKVKIDGHCFDSQKEANYYCELKIRLKAGDILGYCLQPKFILSDEITYTADFIIFGKNSNVRIIDIKGYETDVFKLKQKLFKEKYKYLELEVIK